MQQLMHSFYGTTAPPEILDAVRQGKIGAFCLFAHMNVESPEQLRALNLSLIAAAESGGLPPPILGIDQEGGQLMAVAKGATELPGNMALGATRSPELAYKAGVVLARELLAMGVNLNFAPSLDVNINSSNPVIGIRSFGDDPALVAALGVASLQGMQAEGLIATAKHFPGHGDTMVDSHHSVPVVSHSLTRMQQVELLPFRAAIDAGVKAVMSAHVLFSELDKATPATLSSAILTGLLRREMAFEGLILTDAMDMYAVAHLGTLPSVQAAIEAGADLVLLAHLPDQLALMRQTAPLENAASVARIMQARQQIPRDLPSLDVVGCAEHQQIAQQIADHSITLVRDAGCLPLRPAEDDLIAVITPTPRDLTPADTSSAVKIQLADAVRRRHARVLALELSHQNQDDTLRSALEACADAAVIIVGTINAENDPMQAEFVRALLARGQQPIVVAMRTPYDLVAFPEVKTYLCAYGIRAVTTEAIARVLFGEIPARGKLPCAIPGIAQSGTNGTRL